MFRGREVTHPERGTALLDRLAGELSEIGVVEQAPVQDGRNMTMLLAPSKAVLVGEKDKVSDGRQEKTSDGRRSRGSGEPGAEAVPAGSTPNGAGEATDEPIEETAASGARGARSRGAAA